jgi:hypothetical protein
MEDVIDRLRALPEEDQDAIAAEVEFILAEPASMLSLEQWSEVDVELAATDEHIPHSVVMSQLRARFGR